MKMTTLCMTERFCKCGSELMIEYAGDPSADSAVVRMFDELHHGPDCGPVSPQVAAVARSKMVRRELRHRIVEPEPEPDEATEDWTNVPDEETPLFCAVRDELAEGEGLPQ